MRYHKNSRKKLNNKGFSLVEVLVVVAMSIILASLVVVIMTNSSTFFRKQSTQIDLSNESQIVTSQLNEAFMEATAYEYTDMGGGSFQIVLYDATAKNMKRTLYYDKANTTLYLAGGTAEPVNSEGFALSHYVTNCIIEIDEVSKVYEIQPDGSKVLSTYSNPLMINVVAMFEHVNEKKTLELSIRVRNTLEKIEIDTTEYEMK